MSLNLLRKLRPIISIHPQVMGGVPRYKNTRIPVYLVVEHFAKGWNNKEIHKLFPDVSLSRINQTISVISSEIKNAG